MKSLLQITFLNHTSTSTFQEKWRGQTGMTLKQSAYVQKYDTASS